MEIQTNTLTSDDLEICATHDMGNELKIKRDVPSGTVIMELQGKLLPLTTQPSGDPEFDQSGQLIKAGVKALQVAENTFLQSTMPNNIDDNLNHSFNPNCYMYFKEGKVFLVASINIALGETLTFNYNETEWDMIAQECDFSDSLTGIHVAGFSHLTPDEKYALASTGRLSPFILFKYIQQIDSDFKEAILEKYPENYLQQLHTFEDKES